MPEREPARVARRILVSGRVQGVWFRDSCRAEARLLGVGGWARNLEDGRVEIIAEGSPAAVARLVRWAHDGPPRAEVTDVSVEPVEPSGARYFAVR